MRLSSQLHHKPRFTGLYMHTCVWPVITGSRASMLTQFYPCDWPLAINKQTCEWVYEWVRAPSLPHLSECKNKESWKSNRNTCSSRLSMTAPVAVRANTFEWDGDKVDCLQMPVGLENYILLKRCINTWEPIENRGCCENIRKVGGSLRRWKMLWFTMYNSLSKQDQVFQTTSLCGLHSVCTPNAQNQERTRSI